jgi:hypothetical protein
MQHPANVLVNDLDGDGLISCWLDDAFNSTIQYEVGQPQRSPDNDN